PIDRYWQMHVLHLRLQINHAVLQRKTPLQHIGMPLDLNLAFARLVIDRDTARARARWNAHTCYARESERLEEPQGVGQIPEAFTKKNRRRPGAEGVRVTRPGAITANFETEPQRDDRFMRAIVHELIFAV